MKNQNSYASGPGNQKEEKFEMNDPYNRPQLQNPYLAQIPFSKMSKEERLLFCEDYLQAYSRDLLNDEEYGTFRRLKGYQSMIGLSLAVLVPLSCIGTLNARHHVEKYYARMIQTVFTTCGAGAAYFYVRNQQHSLFEELISKYFTHLDDEQIKNYHALALAYRQQMEQQRAAEEQRQLYAIQSYQNQSSPGQGQPGAAQLTEQQRHDQRWNSMAPSPSTDFTSYGQKGGKDEILFPSEHEKKNF